MKLLVSSYGTLFVAFLVALGMFAAKPGPQSQAGDSSATGPGQPVLLELFTSEGCSSCPPADRLLEIFDRTQPVAGAEFIVLSEHVDYWNRLGWTDPFSSALFTQRQQDYVTQLHLDGAYTPQLVIDGQKDVVGSDERAARAAILRAETHSKAAIDLRAQHSGTDVMIWLRVTGGGRATDVYVALADDHEQSQVTRGENSGHTLHHVAVVRTLLLAGKTDAQGAFARDLSLPLRDGNNAAWRLVVFLQDFGSKHVLGAAETPYSSVESLSFSAIPSPNRSANAEPPCRGFAPVREVAVVKFNRSVARIACRDSALKSRPHLIVLVGNPAS